MYNMHKGLIHIQGIEKKKFTPRKQRSKREKKRGRNYCTTTTI